MGLIVEVMVALFGTFFAAAVAYAGGPTLVSLAGISLPVLALVAQHFRFRREDRLAE